MSVDAQKLTERIRKRIINRLTQAGISGVGRSELVEVADHNNYRRGAAVLDQMRHDGTVQRINGRYMLSDSLDGSFWFTSDPTPEPAPIAVWRPEPLAPGPNFWDLGPSFWEQEQAAVESLEPSGFWA